MTRTAEELAKKQKEVSVAEFFERNRHLLGFDNKRKALLTVVKEAVDNALDACEEARILPEIKIEIIDMENERFRVIVEDNGPGIIKAQIPKIFGKLLYGSKFFSRKQSLTGDEPIMIKQNNKIEIISIGELVDKYNKNNEVTDASNLNIEVPAFDKKKYKYSFQKVSHLIKHKRANEIYELTLKSGRKLKVTGCHSVFGVSNLEVIEIEARNLKNGDYLCVPSKISIDEEKNELNILDYIDENKVKKKNWYIYGISKEIIKNIFLNTEIIHKKTDKSRKYFRFKLKETVIDVLEDSYKYNYLKKGFLPVELYKKLNLNISDAKIKTYFHGEKYELPLIWPITKSLARFLGFYVAEGHCDDRQIGFTFNETEKEFIKEITDFALSYGLNYTIERRPKNSCVRVKLFGGVLSNLVESWCGKGAKNKKIPDFIFTSSSENRQHFLDAYYQGDGHLFKNKNQLTACTVSKKLANELVYLWLTRGVIACIRKNKFKGLGKSPSISYMVDIYGKNINQSHIFNVETSCENYIGKIPKKIKHEIITDEGCLLTKSKESLKLKKIINSDLAFLKIKNIKKIREGYDYVYDLSVPGFENFVGGLGGISCHNSRGQQGMGISAALLYAQLTTGRPAKITSKTGKNKEANYMEIRINTQQNAPEVLNEKIVEYAHEHGTRIELDVEATYQKGGQSVDAYVKQTAIVNPHATIIYTTPKAEQFIFARITNDLPTEPKEIKPHPYGVEHGILTKMLKSTESRTLQSFLTTDFSRVGAGTAKDICSKANLLTNMKPSELNHAHVDKLMQGIKETQIISPSTDCLSPIGEELMEKGLRKEINAEFYTAVSRKPSVYRGIPFVIECCTSDSKLILDTGEIMSIKTYVESELKNKVFAMDENLKIRPASVFFKQKFRNIHPLLELTTKSGRKLKLTTNNEIPILEDGEIIWKAIGETKTGEFLGVPRKIKLNSKIPCLLDLLDPKHVKILDFNVVKNLIDNLLKIHKSLKESSKVLEVSYDYFKALNRLNNPTRPTLYFIQKICSILNLDFQNVKSNIKTIRYVDNDFYNNLSVTVPDINEDLLYALGLLNSDGYISKGRISFVNLDESLHELFKHKMKNLFNVEVKRFKVESYFCNKTLYIILKKLESIIPTLPDNLIISWLKGFVDGDGWVQVQENNKICKIGIATAKRERAELVQTLLLRLGILSKIEIQKVTNTFGFINGRVIKTKKPKHNVIITGLRELRKFSSLISFRQVNRANKLNHAIIDGIKETAAYDVLPIGKKLKELREENNLYQYELGLSDLSVRQIEKGRQNITRQHLTQLISEKKETLLLEDLKLFVFSDILWDEIVTIKSVNNEEFVYDLTTEFGNFVANNIVMHNCAIAYGGDQPSEGSINLLRYANKVPLLYQQSAGAIFKSVIGTSWRSYGLQQSSGALPQGPVTLAVHLASVWPPFTSEAKEALASYPEIIKEIKLALQECGRKLGSYVNKKRKLHAEQKKRGFIEKYIPHVCEALTDLLKLTKKDQELIGNNLKQILEKHRGQLKTIEIDNPEYDEELANIGKEEQKELDDYE